MDFIFIQGLTGLSDAASLFLVAAGLTLIFGVTRILNLAHGSIYLLGAFLTSFLTQYLLTKYNFNSFLTAALLSAIATGILGAIMEIVVLKRLYKSPELMHLLATFALSLIIQQGLLVYFGQVSPALPSEAITFTQTRLIDNFVSNYDFILILVAPLTYGLLWLLLNRTSWGLRVRASTNDRNMAIALGIRQDLLFSSVLFLGCFLAGLGGALQLPKQTLSIGMDYSILIQGLCVVMIGGLGSVTGAFIASLVVALTNAYLVALFPMLNGIIPFGLLMIILLIKPQGFLGLEASTLSGTIRSFTELPNYQILLPGNILRVCVTLLVGGLILLPFLTQFNPNYASMLNALTEAMIFILLASSLQLLMSDGGVSSLGHAAFFGVGAVSASLFYQYFSTDSFLTGLDLAMWPALILPAIIGAIFGIITGLINGRISGLYMAFFMLALCQVLKFGIDNFLLYSGHNSFTEIEPARNFANPVSFYYLTLTIVGFSILTLFLLKYSPFGLILRACRDSKERAQGLGISLTGHRLIAHMTMGFFATLSGSLYSFFQGNIGKEVFDFSISLDATLILLVGGIHNIFSPIIGGFLYKLTEIELQVSLENWRYAFGGFLICLVVLFPHGIVGTIERYRLQKSHPKALKSPRTRKV